jgi:SdiA-regulated protein
MAEMQTTPKRTPMPSGLKGKWSAVVGFGFSASLALASCGEANEPSLEAFSFDEPDQVVLLEKPLKEISGLAVSTHLGFVTHNDEKGTLYFLSPDTLEETGRAKLSLDGRPVRGDFEGVTISSGFITLVDSMGNLYRHSLELDHDTDVYDTGVGKACEVEGLTFLESRDLYLLACKTVKSKALLPYVTLFSFQIGSRTPGTPFLQLPRRAIEASLGREDFRPSGLAHSLDETALYILSSKPRAILKVSIDGEILGASKLSKANHPQPEGLAILDEKTLAITDEGKNGPGRISLYRLAK